MNKSKICSRCKIEKDVSNFRIRKERRPKRGDFAYYNNTCRQCDNELAKIYHEKHKDSEEFKIKNKKRAKQYYDTHLGQVRSYAKNRRQTPKYKKYVYDYYRKNRNKILSQHANVCKRAAIEMRDWYLVGIICHDAPQLRKLVKENSDYLEVKKLQLQLKRTINERKNNC